MCLRPTVKAWRIAVLCATFLFAAPMLALVEPDSPSELSLHHPDLDITKTHLAVSELAAPDAAQARIDLQTLGVPVGSARIDSHSGSWDTLMPVQPLWPGDGVGNDLRWQDLGLAAPQNPEALEQVAWEAFAAYLDTFHRELRLNLAEIPGQGRVTVHDGGKVVQFYVPRSVGGIPVRGSYLTAVANRGNLILLGTTSWAPVDIRTEPHLSLEQANDVVKNHLTSRDANLSKPELILVPTVAETGGYTHRLAYVIRVQIARDLGSWEALVDAHNGELLSFKDMNHYAEVKGGVYPVTNDGVSPDGVEQAGWPMPFETITHSGGTATTDSGGNIPGGVSGNRTSDLAGQYVRMNDNCGSISLTTSGDIDFGTSGGDDCTTPGFGGAGNTHASRSGFFELNRTVEMAQSHLPSNNWLQQQLTSNMNINNTCNAFWNGVTVNFYRSGGGCSNTGEIAGVFVHEWGHGIDDNDAVPTIAGPSGEGIADIYTALRLDTSCIGRNFRTTPCTGFGDPCLTCTGVRDIDYLQRQSGQPHDYSWSNANCGGSVHCVGAVYAEAVWSLWKRILQSAPYNYDNNTAHEIVNRLTFIGAGNTGTWFSGGPPNGGCAAGSGYMNYLAADDDNGNLNDGTPHMGAIFEAFDDQEIACGSPTVQDSGCSGTPTAAPNVTATPLDKSVNLSWNAVSGASEYEIFRTDGVFACDFGKVKVGSTTGLSFTDNGLQNGRDYSYVVIAKGPSDSCFGPASACDTLKPAAGPNLDIDAGSAALAISGGDGDEFLDNCESGTFTFDVNNTGIGTLTNVRIVAVTPTSHPSTTVTTSFPAATSPSTVAQGGSASGSFSFIAGGLSTGDTLTFLVEVTADELTVNKSANFDVQTTESDFQFFASKTFTFESGTEGWQTIEGTFNRSSSGGGAQGTTWYEDSSANLDNQCDHIRGPIISLTASSTMALWNQYDIEPFYNPSSSWYDRANVGIYEVATGSRTAVNPDGGRLYNASGANGNCGTTGQGGWADAATTWGQSTWSASALGSAGFAGDQVQLDVRYGTDPSLNGFGFHFDQVTVTDFNQQGADGQSDSCGCSVNADCDDGAFCNGAETCVAGSCQAGTPPACDDGAFCNGTETCNEGTDSCDAGTPPACDDGAFCNGTETCNEGTDSCDAGTPPACDDGDFCNGTETCNEGTDSCDPGSDPCAPGETCDEANDVCIECTVDADCNDGAFCNGTETCNAGVCQAGTPVNCDDGAFCNGTETCNEGTDSCDAGTPVNCDDGAFCNGTETCNEGTDSCDAGTPVNCDDGAFCNGTETCNEGTDSCDAGTPPCSGGQTCNETTDICEGGSNPTLWMSFRSNTSVPGVGTVTDEDVVSYDEVTGTWALEFDGSDVGLGSFEIDGLAVLPGGDLLLSFRQSGTVGGVSTDDSDVVRFTPTSLGTTTAGSFSLYFDGSDVNLTSNGEDVDAVGLAADGRLIVSTQGGFSGSGASGADEDLFIFTGTLGSSTSGSFAQYFDGSDVGLGGNSALDVDAAALTAGGNLLFSIIGNGTVGGSAVNDEDVVEFSGTFGTSTSGSFSVRQDLSTLGIATGEDIGSLFIFE